MKQVKRDSEKRQKMKESFTVGGHKEAGSTLNLAASWQIPDKGFSHDIASHSFQMWKSATSTEPKTEGTSARRMVRMICHI
jgi:hypothetical protein